MRWSALRPVGEPLGSIRADLRPEDVLPAGFGAVFVQSGTAALALALLTVKGQAPTSRSRVILPAYGCPDLVAATLYAGLEPYLVDTAPDSPFYDQQALARELDERVLAVVCVHFLGFREQIADVAAIASRAGAVVVEDSAQALPAQNGTGLADLVVMSFGRGKPAGALGGGCLLVRGEWTGRLDGRHVDNGGSARIPLPLKRILYDLAISPPVYGPLARSRVFGIGDTRYRPLATIQSLDRDRTRAALSQVQVVQSLWPRNAIRVESFLRAITMASRKAPAGWIAEGIACGLITRLPLVTPTLNLRNQLHERLSALGLGSSVMYRRWLPEVPGIPSLRPPETERARHFAERLLTLPVHSGVAQRHFNQIMGTVALSSKEAEHR